MTTPIAIPSFPYLPVIISGAGYLMQACYVCQVSWKNFTKQRYSKVIKITFNCFAGQKNSKRVNRPVGRMTVQKFPDDIWWGRLKSSWVKNLQAGKMGAYFAGLGQYWHILSPCNASERGKYPELCYFCRVCLWFLF